MRWRLVLIALLGAAILRLPAAPGATRPNIIVVMTDDQGYGDLSLHGNPHLQTPNLDQFATAGIQFTRFYVSPVCAPTRASLLTGRYAYRTGVIHTSRGGAKMHGDEQTIAELLAKAGYRTGIFGKWHLGDNYPMRPQDQGFHETLVHKSGGIGQSPDIPNSYFDPFLWENGNRVQRHGYCTDIFFEAALKFIEENRSQPFFVYLPTNTPHTPLEVSPELAAPYLEMGLNDATARVYGMIQNIDTNFGRLLARLDEWELRENTLVIFLSDNGAQQQRFNAGLRDRKGSVYEGGIRVPFFLQWPAVLAGERQIDRIAAHIDLAPTLLDLCKIRRPRGVTVDGQSLLPLWRGEVQPADWPERTLYFQCHRGLTPTLYQNAAAVTQRYKLVSYPGSFNKEGLQTSLANPVLELYDLQEDPGEGHDRADHDPEIVSELRAGYDAWFANVKRTRQFKPGVIHIDGKSPVYLSRYQDASWRENVPLGWEVQIERSGRYEVEIEAEPSDRPRRLFVSWQKRFQSETVDPGEHKARFYLRAGRDRLAVWLQSVGETRTVSSSQNKLGDVRLRRIE